ncbi:type II secretion system F family protein [Rheinheimera sp. 4Y26]|uniref:type II secretion system F family protein n=1 Tax=Rheinheimera sp. 4Y26 TaxID=2977811 RepID=UPI0021B0E66F|nr:type II secretion system F family protein [Rheinheimera sp. 4Y26]MCT6700633.1 type II secretion system F family protein [Rheinheimera sp. 4Y26]
MNNWEFEAVDPAGAKVKGRVRADSEQAALLQVQQRNLSPLKVRVVKLESDLFSRISAGEIEQMTTELALLLRNGVQLDRALEMMSAVNPNQALAALLTNMTEEVRGGGSLYGAFARFPRYFDSLFCEMVRIGEETGKLAETLERVAASQKFQNELKGKVNQAMIYPAFILVVCIVALFAIFNFIVPSMSGLFSNMKDIPAYTAFLIDTSNWMQKYQGLLVGFFVLLLLLVVFSWRKPAFKAMVFSILRKLPVMKTGLLLSERIRYVSAMHLMLQSGLPLAQALGFAVGVLTDSRLQGQIRRVRDEVTQGRMLSESLALTDILEPVMLSLIKVGEESGRLDSIFAEITTRTRWRFEQWALRLTSMLEPLLIIIMGGLVGSVVVTMLLSIVATTDVPL